jgi:DNA repair protein RecO (recombination protein O)
MSRSQRVSLTPGYVLHHRPWRDTSRILEVFTREHGRLTLFARGVRGPGARLAPLLQPFQPLLLSWSGRGEAPALAGAERAPGGSSVPGACLLGCFYLNELLLRLTTRHDALPELFDTYHGTLSALGAGAPLEPTLRIFEKRLLEALGYGLDLASEVGSGQRIEPEGYYDFRPGQGLIGAEPHAGALRGRSLLALRA